MWLESSQLHTLPTYQSELSTIAVVLVQITGHAPIWMYQIDMQEVLLEFLPDLYQCCETLMEVEHWMGIPCHIRCETLDTEGLYAMRVRPRAPAAQNAEWVNPCNRFSLL